MVVATFENLVPLSEAKAHLSNFIDKVAEHPFIIMRRNTPAAVLVSPQFYERAMSVLEDLEDEQDIEEFERRRADGSASFTSAEKLRAELEL